MMNGASRIKRIFLEFDSLLFCPKREIVEKKTD